MRPDAVVVDTSIALKWVLDEPDSPLAAALLTDWIGQGAVVFAPALLVYEATNALHQNVRQNVVALARAAIALNALHRIGLTLDPPDDPSLSVRAVELAQQLALGPAYDTQFLALAEREDCEYWTADQRFWTTARASHPRVRWLGERATAATP